MTENPTTPDVAGIAEAILRRVGTDQMGELYNAIPDLIHEEWPGYQNLDHVGRVALVQRVAEQFSGEGYIYTYPVA